MALLITARLSARACKSQVLSSSFQICSHKITGINNVKALASITQTRWINEKSSTADMTHIYKGSLSKVIKAVKIFSLTTSMGTLLLQPILLPQYMKMESLILVMVMSGSFGIFAFLTPILLHILSKRYIVNIYHNKSNQSYIATTYSIFAREKQMQFTPDDVTQPQMASVFATCIIKGQPVFIDAGSFENPNDYRLIMGYDKPMEFSIFSEAIDAKKSNKE